MSGFPSGNYGRVCVFRDDYREFSSDSQLFLQSPTHKSIKATSLNATWNVGLLRSFITDEYRRIFNKHFRNMVNVLLILATKHHKIAAPVEL